MHVNRYGDEDTDGNLNDVRENVNLIIKTMVV